MMMMVLDFDSYTYGGYFLIRLQVIRLRPPAAPDAPSSPVYVPRTINVPRTITQNDGRDDDDDDINFDGEDYDEDYGEDRDGENDDDNHG